VAFTFHVAGWLTEKKGAGVDGVSVASKAAVNTGRLWILLLGSGFMFSSFIRPGVLFLKSLLN
jgi:hypothetical protein